MVTLEQAQHMSEPVRLRIYSSEGGIYTAMVMNGGGTQTIVDKEKHSIMARSVNEMKEKLHGVPVSHAELVQFSAYDEMIGTDTQLEPMITHIAWE